MTARSWTAGTGELELIQRLARRAPAFQSSVWDTVARLVSGGAEDTIYFGNGTPSREVIPFERLSAASLIAWQEVMNTPGALDYGDAAGHIPLRQLIADRMGALGIAATPDNVILTNGSQQGIDYLCRLMLDPGDTIVVEGPTYLGALQIFDSYQVKYITAPMDEHGLDIDALIALLDKSEITPKLLYTIPTFQNPTGITMPLDRRKRLVALARARGILILEDDPYGELWVDEQPPAPLRALDDQVAYLGTFSKTIAPGLRRGWIVTPPG
ncbi:MAG: PLP-dependent aminotransferase family protein, partial [Thermomicrobiales bacterium]